MIRTIGFLALLSLGWAAAGGAQPAPAARTPNWELNLHAAALRPDLFEESTGALQLGARFVRNFAPGVSLGGNVDWARAEDVAIAPFGGLSASIFLYSAEIDVRFEVTPRAQLFLAGGAGAATLIVADPPVGLTETSTGLLFPVGGGFKILNRPTSPRWAFRFDVRDNVILRETVDGAGGDVQNEPRHNLEVSAGFSFLFGGDEGEAPLVDSDRDGVPDPLDYCLNRPGLEVDSRGCPIDQDVDGVPDGQDECPGTPAGVRVDDRGCALEPEAETGEAEPAPVPAETPPRVAEPPPTADTDRDGVPDDRDQCPDTPRGIRVDARGCLAMPPVTPVPMDETGEPPAEGIEAPAQGRAACLDSRSWFTGRRPIEFDGRRFELVGFPQPVDAQYLTRLGEFDGVPVYASTTARAPYTDLWLPRCGTEPLYELYVQAGTLP